MVTLLLWGGTMLYFWWSDRIASYLHPQFHSYVLVAGAGLVVLSILWWWAHHHKMDKTTKPAPATNT